MENNNNIQNFFTIEKSSKKQNTVLKIGLNIFVFAEVKSEKNFDDNLINLLFFSNENFSSYNYIDVPIELANKVINQIWKNLGGYIKLDCLEEYQEFEEFE